MKMLLSIFSFVSLLVMSLATCASVLNADNDKHDSDSVDVDIGVDDCGSDAAMSPYSGDATDTVDNYVLICGKRKTSTQDESATRDTACLALDKYCVDNSILVSLDYTEQKNESGKYTNVNQPANKTWTRVIWSS